MQTPGAGAWPETRVRLMRWLLLASWLLLILSLLIPAVQVPEALLPDCPLAQQDCTLHRQPGNRIFWGTVVPGCILLIAAGSHEIWRRICPLAFVSQLFRHLGMQRTSSGRGGHAEVVKVNPDSWLGRHHIQLQWSLLIAGLCLRLLVVNSSPVGLAVLLIGSLVAALVVGWAYGGKAWCQYVCPMGPVQAVLTGPRGPLGSTAHLGSRSRITQSMCRTVGDSGNEQSACVACQAPCLDIDAERSYWQTITGKRGFAWAWYSYPGLVLAFYGLMEISRPSHWPPAATGLSYLCSGLWAFDADLTGRLLDPWLPQLPLPRLLALPGMLVLAATVSVAIFQTIEQRLRPPGTEQSSLILEQRAISRTRLLATFTAVNIFFWFADPSQGAFGTHGAQLLRSVVLTISAIWLFRSWGRDPAVYRRESTSESLRRQLKDLPGLQQALDGRSLDQLSPQEVFTLVKAMPVIGHQRALEVYGRVLADMLQSGRLNRAESLLQLQDLRDSLHLEPEDHHQAIRRLAEEQPDLLRLDWRERQAADLRREAAADALQDLITTAGLEVLEPALLRPALQQKLEQLRAGSGLGETAWREELDRCGPRGDAQQRRLEQQRQLWRQNAGCLRGLEQAAASDPLLQPLVRAMVLRVETLGSWLSPRLDAAGLDPLPQLPPSEGSCAQGLDLLWQDPDPDTAGWVLLVEQRRDPRAAARRRSMARPLETTSAFLERQRSGDAKADREVLAVLAASALFADQLPSGLVWLMQQGVIRHWPPGSLVLRQGDDSDELALVIQGEAQLLGSDGSRLTLGPGQTIGAMGVITGTRRSRTVEAGPRGLQTLDLPAGALEELLRRSRSFSLGLLRELAVRLHGTSAEAQHTANP
jgi:hypothetical protein